MPQFDTSTYLSQIFWLIITVGALYLLMARIALPRIAEVMKQRADRISDDLEKAEALKAEAEEAVKVYEKALDKARRDAADVLAKANQEVARSIAARQQTFTEALSQRVDAAEERIAAARQAASGEIYEIARAAAAEVAERLIGGPVVSGSLDTAMRSAAERAQ